MCWPDRRKGAEIDTKSVVQERSAHCVRLVRNLLGPCTHVAKFAMFGCLVSEEQTIYAISEALQHDYRTALDLTRRSKPSQVDPLSAILIDVDIVSIAR